MSRPRKVTYNRGCLLIFIAGFFFVPAGFLLVLAFLSRSEDYCVRSGPMCLPSPEYLPYYLVLGLLFLAGGIASWWIMVRKTRR